MILSYLVSQSDNFILTQCYSWFGCFLEVLLKKYSFIQAGSWPMCAAALTVRSAPGWLRSILQSPCHHPCAIYGLTTEFQTTWSCSYFHPSHPFMDADVTNLWLSALLNSQINMKLFRVPLRYLNAAYCSVALSFHKLAWCTVSNVIFWMLCWKRLLKGAHHKINALLYRHCKLPLQIWVADIFLSQTLECLKPMYLLKIHHKKKQNEETSIIIPQKLVSHHVFFLCISTNKSTGSWCYVWENIGIQTLQQCVFFMFIHM